MDPLTAIALADTAYKVGTGIKQGIQANRLKKNLGERPVYTPPSAAQMALENARSRASQTRFPGQAVAEERLGAASSNAYRMAQEGANSSAGLLAATSAINANQVAGEQDLSTKASEYQQANQDKYNQALMSYASYEDNAFKYNQADPYESSLNTINNLKTASQANISGATSGAASIASSQAGNDDEIEKLKNRILALQSK